MKRLPDTELEVMKALWATGPDTPRATLEDRLSPFGWAANTNSAYLSRLAEKGFVQIRKEGRSARYIPLIARRDYLAQQSRRFVQKVCGGSLPAFAAALCDSGLTREELAQLRELLERDAL